MRRSRGYTRRYSRRIKTVKYSNETTGFGGLLSVTSNSAQLSVPLIAKSETQGTRKCKNFELSLTGAPWANAGEGNEEVPLIWALVYVPEGTNPSGLRLGSTTGTASLYEPSQNVIMSGVWPGALTTPYKVKSRLARNLNSGDSIYFVITAVTDLDPGAQKNIVVSLNYAIAY